ncbi:MAG TPA: DUF1569 domain-containing protein [Acidobacteriaceae bacterium]|nr:DUF1569 domain-containing protein [Acidobacteriaceae bacterium]
MKNLFDPAVADDVKQRILRLVPENERQWGSMALARTLAHCTCGLQMAMGSINPRRERFPASVIGLLIRPLVFRDDKPLRRNSPSTSELFLANPVPSDFERERNQLIDALDSFATRGAAGCSRHPHPFFGPLKPQQWSILMYKHLDHHLRQFGA